MKKKLHCVVISCFFVLPVIAQQSTTLKKSKPAKGFLFHLGLALPLGDFSSTHLFGIAVEASPSYHKFKLKNSTLSKFALTYHAGVAYYLGKKETVNSHPYKYPAYIFIHGFGGVLYVPSKKTEVSLTAGPALGIYNSTTRFNIGSKLDFSYHINSKISVGPGIIMMKEFGADALWAASVIAAIKL